MDGSQKTDQAGRGSCDGVRVTREPPLPLRDTRIVAEPQRVEFDGYAHGARRVALDQHGLSEECRRSDR